MARMDGTDILILVNTGTPSVPVYEALATQRTMSDTDNRTVIDLSAKGDDHDYVEVGRQTNSLTVECVYDPEDDAYEAVKAAYAAKGDLLVRRSENAVDVEEATAKVSGMSKAGPDQAPATVSLELRLKTAWTTVGS